MLEIPEQEVIRYLGYHGTKPTPEVLSRLRHCCERLQEVATPRTTHQFFPLEQIDDCTLKFAEIVVKSHDLSKNLQNCRRVCMFAATIGTEVDRLIRQAEVRRMSDAVIYQAAGAAMVEELCDQFNQKIQQEAEKDGMSCRPRFSPGYGDFSLEHQRDFARILNTPKTLGVTLLDTLLMTPSKSVTAVIGQFAAQAGECPRFHRQNHCNSCDFANCPYSSR